MKIAYTNKHDWRKRGEITTELSAYIAGEIQDDIYDGDERARRTTEKIAEAFGQLVEILTKNKVLGVEDIARIAGTEYSHENIQINEPHN